MSEDGVLDAAHWTIEVANQHQWRGGYRCTCGHELNSPWEFTLHVAEQVESLMPPCPQRLLGQVEALAAGLLATTQEGQGRVSDHWRGNDYADGFDAGLEHAAERLMTLAAAIRSSEP